MATFDCFSVTHCKINLVNDNEKVKAQVEIVLNDQLIMRGLELRLGLSGLFVAYPLLDKENCSLVVGPTTRALREHIENVVFEEYQKALEK